MKDKNNIWKICSIVSIVIIVILVIYIIATSVGKNGNTTSKVSSKNEKASTSATNPEEDMRRIRIDEDFSKEGKIDGIENVRWNDAMIRQNDNKMGISITLNNESDTEKIEARNLQIILLDKEGKQITTKDVQMQEIPAQYGYTMLDFEIEEIEPALIYDVQIVAK